MQQEFRPSKMQQEAEKLLQYRYKDRERERSNRAAQIADSAKGTKRRCLTTPKHAKFAYSGPPHDAIRAYICIYCGAACSEPEVKDRGYDFWTVPDWIMDEIFDLDLERQGDTNQKFFGGFGDAFGQ